MESKITAFLLCRPRPTFMLNNGRKIMTNDQIVLDFNQLKMLSGDDNEFMIEILEMIADQSPSIVSQMNQLYEEAEFVSLGSTAHLFKSTVTILGNEEINGLLKDIENTATQAQDAEALLPMMNRFREMTNSIIEQVQTELSSIK